MAEYKRRRRNYGTGEGKLPHMETAKLDRYEELRKQGQKKSTTKFVYCNMFVCSTYMEKVHAMSDKKSLFKLGCTRQASTKHGTTKKTTPNWDGI